jgi:hypothetical protein
MQGYEHSNTAPKSTYGSLQNSLLHEAMQTGTVVSELTGSVKKLHNLYKYMYLTLLGT